MELIKIISWILFYAINIFVALHFLIPVINFALHWVLEKDPKKLLNKYKKINDLEYDFAAIITAHQDVRFIPPFIDSFLKQDYNNYIVYVVADDCDISGLQYNNEHIKILKPSVPFHSKVKSIKYAVSKFARKHNALIIFDSDNLVHPNYLRILNNYFQHGFKVVQANMLSKNLDSTFSKLDTLGHVYHNFQERQVKMEMGITSAILGLGVAIDIDVYNEIMYTNELGGFDKKLQVQLAKKLPHIAYAKDVIVYDEKVDDGASFEKQRTRWIFTYFEYFGDSISLFIKGITTFHAGRLLLGFNMLRPPMFITLGMAFILMLTSYFVQPTLFIAWLIVLGLFSVNFLLIVATQSQQKGILSAIFHLPYMIFKQIKSLLKIKQAKKGFLKTEHRKIIYIEDLLKNELV